MSTVTEKGSTKTHFGRIGWGLIVFGALQLMVTGSFWASSAVNVVAVQVQMLLGLENPAPILAMNTVIGLIAVAVVFIMGTLHAKIQARILVPIEFILLAVGLLLVGHIKTLPQYLITYLLVYCMAQCIAQIGLGIVFGNYMPTKKGVALGWTTIGASLNTVIALPVLNALCGARGFAFGCSIFAIYMIILGILHFVLWPDDPRKRGYEPDNGDITEEQLKAIEEVQKNQVKNWTMKEAVANKNFWCLAIGYGLLFLCTVGIASQLVVFETLNGVPQAKAIGMMSFVALGGVLSSIASGYVDQKFGTKVMAMCIGISYALSAFFAGFCPFTKVTNVLFILFYCVVVGAMSNLPVSHAIGVYGPDFKRIWRAIIPITQCISAFAGLLLGAIRGATGGYAQAYRVLVFIALVAVVIFAISDSKMIKKPGEKPIAVKIKN